MAIELLKTERGIIRADFHDRNGIMCSIQQSSVATEDLIWFGVNDPNPQFLPGNATGWHPYPLPDNVHCTTRMHLTREQVKDLLPLLQRFAVTGDLEPAEERLVAPWPGGEVPMRRLVVAPWPGGEVPMRRLENGRYDATEEWKEENPALYAAFLAWIDDFWRG